MLTLGEPLAGSLVEIPKDKLMLSASVPGQSYALVIDTKGIANPEQTAQLLVDGLYQKFQAKTYYIQITTTKITTHIEGSPFAWALLIPWIPTILASIGVIVTLAIVYNIIQGIPGWVWATLVIGVTLIIFGPAIGETFKIS